MSAPIQSVAVVVPCYNAANELGATLRALLDQTYSPDEIIVVDNGSKDESAAIAESFGGTVRVVRQANAGAARARYRGVQEARSDLIVFNDAGDISTPDRVERLRSALLSHPECVAAYGMTWIKSRPKPKVWKRTGGPLDGSLTVAPDALNRCLAQNWPLVIGMNLAVRREVAMQSAQVPAFYKAANDYALQVRTASLGSFVHVAAVTLEYEETQGGISSQNGSIQQTGYALCAAAETLDSLDDCTGIDVEAFRKRVESWPGIALRMYLRGNWPLMRKVIGIGFRFGRVRMLPRRLWWALDSANKEGTLERAPLLSALVRALNRIRSTTR